MWPFSLIREVMAMHAVCAAIGLLAAWGVLSCACADAAEGAGEKVLFNFDAGFDFAKVDARGVTVSAAKRDAGQALRMAVKHDQDWPGITLPAPGGSWDLSAHTNVSLNVKNTGKNEVTVCCRVDNPGADGSKNCVTGSITLQPGV
jgi:hypothetical protein